MADPYRDVEPIPAGHRLLHIGLPKSGTTSLQSAAASRRHELLRAGVLYPGRGVNHRLAMSAAMARRTTGSSRPARASDWTRLARRVERAPQRVLLSYELVCAADDAGAARILDGLGRDRTHVVITVRAQAAMLPSIWQQYVKNKLRRSFDRWAEAVLGEPGDPKVTPSFHVRHDLAAVCERWATLVGADRVTVVMLDKAAPELLPRAFEALLALPEGMLEPVGAREAENRSLTFAEIELVRRVQKLAHRGRLGERPRSELITHGLAPALQSRPAEEEDRGRVPVQPWVDRAAQEQGRTASRRLEELGVRVVGDPGVMSLPGPVSEDAKPPRAISVEAVAVAVAGVADLGLPMLLPVRRSRSTVSSTGEALVRRQLAATRGSAWLRRHGDALQGLADGEARARTTVATGDGSVDMDLAAAMVAGVISRVAGRGEFFSTSDHERSRLSAVREAWIAVALRSKRTKASRSS